MSDPTSPPSDTGSTSSPTGDNGTAPADPGVSNSGGIGGGSNGGIGDPVIADPRITTLRKAIADATAAIGNNKPLMMAASYELAPLLSQQQKLIIEISSLTAQRDSITVNSEEAEAYRRYIDTKIAADTESLDLVGDKIVPLEGKIANLTKDNKDLQEIIDLDNQLILEILSKGQ